MGLGSSKPALSAPDYSDEDIGRRSPSAHNPEPRRSCRAVQAECRNRWECHHTIQSRGQSNHFTSHEVSQSHKRTCIALTPALLRNVTSKVKASPRTTTRPGGTTLWQRLKGTPRHPKLCGESTRSLSIVTRPAARSIIIRSSAAGPLNILRAEQVRISNADKATPSYEKDTRPLMFPFGVLY